MKTNRIMPGWLVVVSFLFIQLLAGCNREVTIDLDKGFSSQIQQIVPQPILDTLRKKGMVINEGLVPPQLDGIYIAEAYKLLVSYGPDDSWRPGKIIDPYYYRFYGQTADNNIKYDFTNKSSDKGLGQGAFVSGNGTSFTIFSQDVGVSSSVPYKTLAVISGELTPQGIKNFQYAFVMKEKTGDTDNSVLIAVGKSRIWIDSDGLAAKTNTFPQSIKPGADQQLLQLKTIAQPSNLRTQTGN